MSKELKNEFKKELEKTPGLLAKLMAIKVKFNATPPPPPVVATPVAMGSATLKDGTSVSYQGDKLDVGVAVNITNGDGTTAPAKDGEMELADGSKIVIKDGKVESVAAAPAAPPMTTPEMMTQFSELKTQLAAQAKKIEGLETKNKELETKLNTQGDDLKVTFEAVDKMIEMPVVEPIEQPTKSYEEMTNAEKVRYNRGK